MSKCSLITAGTLGAAVLVASPALALQPLDDFVTASKSRNLDRREAIAGAEQRADEARQAWSRLAPSIVARASYTRNQREVVVEIPKEGAKGGVPQFDKLTITPYDQLDASFTLNVPLVDVGSWRRIGAAGATADAARLRADASGVEAEKAVTRAYYQVVAYESTLVAAQRALATTEESLTIVTARRDAGTASELDMERAKAEVARAKQVVASADQARAVARRSLESLSGLAPSAGTVPLPEDGLAEEPALEALEPGALQLPAVRAAALDLRAAEHNAGAAWSGLYPVITANATERLTNATGFAAQVGTWSLGLTATLTLDASIILGARAQDGLRAQADVRKRRAEQAAKDELHSAWQDVRAQIAKVRAARAEVESSGRAANLARERYRAGSATQFEVMQADRDAFSGQMSKIQAQADLAYARSLVRIDSGGARIGSARQSREVSR